MLTPKSRSWVRVLASSSRCRRLSSLFWSLIVKSFSKNAFYSLYWALHKQTEASSIRLTPFRSTPRVLFGLLPRLRMGRDSACSDVVRSVEASSFTVGSDSCQSASLTGNAIMATLHTVQWSPVRISTYLRAPSLLQIKESCEWLNRMAILDFCTRVGGAWAHNQLWGVLRLGLDTWRSKNCFILLVAYRCTYYSSAWFP